MLIIENLAKISCFVLVRGSRSKKHSIPCCAQCYPANPYTWKSRFAIGAKTQCALVVEMRFDCGNKLFTTSAVGHWNVHPMPTDRCTARRADWCARDSVETCVATEQACLQAHICRQMKERGEKKEGEGAHSRTSLLSSASPPPVVTCTPRQRHAASIIVQQQDVTQKVGGSRQMEGSRAAFSHI